MAELLNLPVSIKDRMDGPSRLKFDCDVNGGRVILKSTNGQKHDLTLREFQVLYFICAYGESNEDLAKRFKITRSTIKNYLTIVNESFRSSKHSNYFDTKKIALINHLVHEGYLTYEPRIKHTRFDKK